MAKKSKGLGDTIDKITTATGIKKIVKAIAGDDCGCEERRKWLNKKFKYAQMMNEEQKKVFEKLNKNIKENRDVITRDTNIAMTILHNELFNRKSKPSSCGSCIRKTHQQLQTIYDNSCE